MTTSWMDRAKILMQSRGISQEELAASMSCTRGAVGHYLNGRRSPSLEQLNAIAAALSVDPAWLLFGDVETGVREGGTEYHGAAVSVPVTAELLAHGKRRRGGGQVCLPASADCYALLIHGDEYEPRVHAGEAVLLDPGAQLSPGDEVAVYSKDRSIRLHCLVRTRKDSLTVDSIAGEKKVRTLMKRDCSFIHKVAAIFQPS